MYEIVKRYRSKTINITVLSKGNIWSKKTIVTIAIFKLWYVKI